MAAMEKITYPPLIHHFKEQSEAYNQLYREHEIKFGAVDHSIISSWMVNIIEPVIKEVTIKASDKLAPLCKALFTELLQLLGNQSGIAYENEYKASWLLFQKIPGIVTVHPKRTIQAIDSAIGSLRMYQPEKVSYWIALMDNTIAYCQSIEELLSVGRINAWLCGMAHLRKKAIGEFVLLRAELKKAIEENTSLKINVTSAIDAEWMNTKQPQFVGEAGGFIGYGGYFTAPPLVAQVENEILATDHKNTCVFFADSFGKVLLSDIPVSPKLIAEKSTMKEFHTFKTRHGRNLIPFDDVSSCVIKNTTMVLTRKSSHYLYVYGWTL